MSPRRRSSPGNEIAGPFFLLLLAGYGALAKFWNNLTLQEKWIFGSLAVVALAAAVGMVVVFIRYRKQQRAEAWNKAMKAYHQNIRGGKTPNFNGVEGLTPEGLEKLAMQVYRQMGYSVSHTGNTGDHGVDVRLVHPNGNVELVQCKQWHKPVGEPEIRNLMGAIVHEKAAKGYLWAPNGFSASARQWVKGKPISLMDHDSIGRLVESVYSN